MKVPDQDADLDSVIIKLNETHLTIMNDLDIALTKALTTLKTEDSSGNQYVIFKDLQNDEKSFHLVCDLIHNVINNEEMNDEYFTKRSASK